MTRIRRGMSDYPITVFFFFVSGEGGKVCCGAGAGACRRKRVREKEQHAEHGAGKEMIHGLLSESRGFGWCYSLGSTIHLQDFVRGVFLRASASPKAKRA
mmetsp:Transcript_27190/g.58258  ORF Transcript_27190/g.58258 Transcript_27190/m.58258 type:complete len:100 (+) Transcript_27190:2085-2384(+)